MSEFVSIIVGAVVGVVVKWVFEALIKLVPIWWRKLLDLAVLPPPKEHRRRRRGKRRGGGRGNGWRARERGYGLGEGGGETLGA